MALRLKFSKSRKILTGLSLGEQKAIGRICEDIREAERTLVSESSPLLSRCLDTCQGLCCRNLDLDSVINLYDLIYIQTVEPGLKKTMLNCLEGESLFTQNCIFLKNEKGPCIFPFDCRPEKCLTTFCVDDRLVGSQIRSLAQGFVRLYRFVRFRHVRRIRSYFFKKSGCLS
jgi:hypothetical protein